MRTATVDHRELCRQTKISRWPWATAWILLSGTYEIKGYEEGLPPLCG